MNDELFVGLYEFLPNPKDEPDNFGSDKKAGLSKMFGKLKDEYEIYLAYAPAPHKSFDEWLNS